MQRLLIVYASREGHTHRVAEYLAESFRERGLFVEIGNALALAPGLALRGSYEAVILAGSVHLGRHERELIRFAAEHRSELAQLPTALVSVSMSEAVLQSTSTTRQQREEAEKRVENAFARFRKESGWHPRRTLSVPGALMYRSYDLLTRFVMRAVARSNGTPTDVSRNHILTDWGALSRFAERFTRELQAPLPVAPFAS